MPPTPSTIAHPVLSPVSSSGKRSKESPLPGDGKRASKLSKTEVVIATPRADPKPDAARNEDKKPHSRLEIVSKPPAPTVSDASDAEESDRSRQIKVPRSAVASSSKGKEKEKITPAEQAVEVVLHAPPTNPYKILGLNWAGEALRVPDARFTANAFGDGDESDGDGDIQMPDYEAKPIPDAYIEKLYARATPLVRATTEPSVFIIQYPLFASQALMAQLMLRGIESTPIEHFQVEYEDSKEKTDKINAIIATLVEENHYPTCWKIKFSLRKDGKQLLRPSSGEDESRPVAMAAEASNLPRTAMWKPGETRQGEPILACKQLFCTRKEGRKIRIPEVTGHLFIVQANEQASRICEISSGSEIGWRATRAHLALPDKKMITRTALRDIWGKGDADAAISGIFESEGEIAPGRVARVEYKPRRALGSKPRRQRYVESSDEMTDDESDSDVEVARDRFNRRPAASTPRRAVLQTNDESDSDNEVSCSRPSRHPAARTPRMAVRQTNDESGRDSEPEVARNRPSSHLAAAASTRQRRLGQGAESRMFKTSAAQDEDPEIANLYLQFARMGQKMDKLMGGR
ncbi:hypothetical protein ACJ73_00700 [Blastomyces percursus]|uniref:Uncharacterized protein n=1 Tax=Blastomyces percursus TaxID=1658174 RepID=A0A1J9R6C6_9EURO|nr:hypothetical protein ACJ73_00700 [Blastomyces percursus]